MPKEDFKERRGKINEATVVGTTKPAQAEFKRTIMFTKIKARIESKKRTVKAVENTKFRFAFEELIEASRTEINVVPQSATVPKKRIIVITKTYTP